MNGRYDIAIIGTGPAGLSAAINAKIRNKKFILFGSPLLSGKIEKAHVIQNYLGLPDKKGPELQNEFLRHLKEMNIEITEKKVINIFQTDDYFSVLANNDVYEAMSVILATGVTIGRIFTGEDTFLGKGVSYCATCDGNFFKGKTVTVIGYGSHEEKEAKYLAGLASKVYYVPMYKDKAGLEPPIEIIYDRPEEILGDKVVKQLKLKERILDTDGIFILRDAINPVSLLPGIEIQENHVKVDRNMRTNIRGCFAAGDLVGKPYQYMKAAGEGNIAALSAASYIDSL